MKLPSQGLTIGAIQETHRLFKDAIVSWSAEEIVDLADISDIDMSGIQLLISLQKTIALKGFSLHLSGLSPYIENSIRLSGCTSLLDASHE